MHKSLLVACFLFVFNLALVEKVLATPEEISSAIFAAEGDVLKPKLSPDGSQMVYRQNSGGKSYLTIRSLSSAETFSKAMPEDTDLNWYRWAGNGQVLFSVSSLKKYLGARANFDDNQFRQVEMYLIDTNSRQSRFIGLENGVPDGDNILQVDQDGRFLLLEVRESVYKYPSVYKIELATNKAEQVVKDQLRVWDWIADRSGIVRMGMSYRRNSTLVFYRNSADEKFKRIDKVKDKDVVDNDQEALLDGFLIIPGSDDGYVLSNEKTGRFGLYKFNLLKREIGEKVFDHSSHDITRFSLDEDGALKAVNYSDSRDRIHWFDEYFAKQQKMLDRTLKDQQVWITSASRDKGKMIIFSTSSQDPGSYYLYEPAAKKMDRFAGVNDRIDPTLMAETKYEVYTARDGTKIPAYVTIPKGKETNNLPLVIMPHGGPYGVRDTMKFDMEVQFLANRGYIVLQPNFRGSSGYGEKFYKQGEGQIGRKMQDDLDDGMDWLVKRGIANPKRVCLVGSSYGGFAALWGVTRNPERYRCAASFAGVTDWKKMLRYDRQFFKSRYSRKWKEIIEGEDGSDLDDFSPVRMLDNLNRPILLVHGKKDSIVPYSQYKLYKDKLEDRDADAVFVTYEKEGHGFKDFDNRKDWLDQLEKFLDEHNPA